MGKLKIWATEEDQILAKISSTVKSKRWKKASEELGQKGYERTDVQCRERYINHLDPSVNKQLWSDQQLEILYTKYWECGNKWFLLQKHLPGRTQTKIKNYFYGNIRYFLKLIVKHFHKKNTGFVNDIKTDTLLDLFDAKNSFQGYSIVPETFRLLGYKVERQACQQIILQNQKAFQAIAQIFIRGYHQKNIQQQHQSGQDNQIQSQSLLRVQCPKAPVLAHSAGHEGKRLDIEYTKEKSQTHLFWYQHYQKAYLALQNKQQDRSSQKFD